MSFTIRSRLDSKQMSDVKRQVNVVPRPLRLIFPFCQIDPIEYVEDICENMQLFPKEDFLTGDQLMFEFNPEVSSSVVWGVIFYFLLKSYISIFFF